MKWIAANWKMNGSRESAIQFGAILRAHLSTLPQDRRLIIAPSFPFLDLVRTECCVSEKVLLGAQSVSSVSHGARTGEVSAEQLRNLGVQVVLVGHSERRLHCHETDSEVRDQVMRLLEMDITPMLCIGETLEERRAARTHEKLKQQLKAVFSDHRILEAETKLLIAYEPIWAIGTGEVATLDQIEDAHDYIKGWIKADCGEALPVLYGGSVKGENARPILASKGVDGVLVGGASLNATDLLKIACS